VGEVPEQLGAGPPDLAADVLGRGAVMTIEEFIGSQLRRWPRMLAVKPSRQRSTTGAVTRPRSVRTSPGSISIAVVCS
jgi:hypothetical protein